MKSGFFVRLYKNTVHILSYIEKILCMMTEIMQTNMVQKISDIFCIYCLQSEIKQPRKNGNNISLRTL
ncbi:MAG: hypothetical protein E7499_02685 [Ruminococcus sp.]|nr:hypothetical protein [Ruminococcus sp.]